MLETQRLRLRRLSLDDAAFILDLLNQPSWLQYIGDKGVRTLDDARRYIEQGPLAMYAQIGFGLYRVELKDSGVPIGLCGLLKRDSLDDVDLGFAFLPAYWSQGYAREAATATLAHGEQAFGLQRIVAITLPDNRGSIRLLQAIGFAQERTLSLAADEPELLLLAWEIGGVPGALSPDTSACSAR